jgi:hypothetical protein
MGLKLHTSWTKVEETIQKKGEKWRFSADAIVPQWKCIVYDASGLISSKSAKFWIARSFG